MREIRRFKPPRVILVLRLALFVRGFFMGCTRGLGVEFKLGVKAGDDLLNEGGFLHKFWRSGEIVEYSVWHGKN